MNKPVLVIMAAGMGSRYGGLKQIDAMDDEGHIIMDFSIYDALLAGFESVVFIIKRDNEKVFKEAIGKRIEKVMKVHYVYQELDDIPAGFNVPEGRVKPWGTAHALYCCRDVIDGPFAVINADDYYGRESFKMIYDYLLDNSHNEYQWAMVGFELNHTLTDNGSVARGVCEIDNDNNLVKVVERTKIIKTDTGGAYSEDDENWYDLPGNSIVSMNLWGFSASVIKEIEEGMEGFLTEGLKMNPMKCEYYIPSVVTDVLTNHKGSVRVLKTSSQWYGVTYKEDKAIVMEAISRMKDEGIYPKRLWEVYYE